MLNGTGGRSSLGRRRGTKARRKSMSTALYGMICLLVIALIGSLSLLFGLYTSLTAEEKQVAVDRVRHRVKAVPEMLRGKKPPPVGVGDPRPPAGDLMMNAPIAGEPAGGVFADVPHLPPAQYNNNYAAAAVDGGGSKAYPYKLDQLATDEEVASYEPRGGFRYQEYTSGKPVYEITNEIRAQSDVLARSRRAYVKKTAQFAWEGYTKYAFGCDEIKPQTAACDNGWGKQGITLVDSLDTLWLMGMKTEFWQARDWVRDHLDHSKTSFTSLFETTIRDLGGLLSAYDLSGDDTFLKKATDLGNRLLHGFDNSPSGIPYGQVNLKAGTAKNIGWTAGNAIISEFGTIQVENRYLSKVTNNPIYAQKTEHIFEVLRNMHAPHGLYPYYVKNDTPNPTFGNNKITFGAMADSFYEYMLKVWLQGGKTEDMYREMYDESIEGMHEQLLQKSSPSGLTYIADKNKNKMDHKMDHLVCFMGGLLALGAYHDPLGMDSPRAVRDMETAKALTYTCYQMYARMATGISPEFVQFYDGRDFQVGRGAPHYLLRPEAIESFYILNQITGDPTYREWGWEAYLSIEKYCKTPVAYGSLPNVQDKFGRPKDKMESFFLAETLKYLYLLQDPDSEIDVLHTHVLNTEAHPLRIFPKLEKTS